MSIDEFENTLVRLSIDKLIEVCMRNGLLKTERHCLHCLSVMKLIERKNYVDEYCWRCNNNRCPKGRPFVNIRKDSFFEGLNLPLLTVLKVLIRWTEDIPQGITLARLEINSRTYKKIIQKFLSLVAPFNFNHCKLGGPGTIVQVDETGLNFKNKAHRGRPPTNKTDALCIVEFKDHITRAFAVVIPDKKATTIVPIICANVANNTIIHTDEHKSYSSLNNIGFSHDTVCHKYSFVNPETGATTQAVKSFNNCVNLDIKKRKGVKPELRQEFLDEFTWKFNNTLDRLKMVLAIIKSRY